MTELVQSTDHRAQGPVLPAAQVATRGRGLVVVCSGVIGVCRLAGHRPAEHGFGLGVLGVLDRSGAPHHGARGVRAPGPDRVGLLLLQPRRAVVNIAAGEENLVERTRAFRVYCSHVVPGLLPRIRGRRHRQVRHLPPGGRGRRGRRGGPGDPAIG